MRKGKFNMEEINKIFEEYKQIHECMQNLKNIFSEIKNKQNIYKNIEYLLEILCENNEFEENFKNFCPCLSSLVNLFQEIDKISYDYFSNGKQAKSQSLISKNEKFKTGFNNYFKNTSVSQKKVLEELLRLLEIEINSLEEKKISLKESAEKLSIQIAKNDSSLIIKNEAFESTSLPKEIVIGSHKTAINFQFEPDQISKQNIPLSVNMKRNGNIVINCSSKDSQEDALYNFICRVVLKYYDSFPLGTLRVHFFDMTHDPRYVKFVSGFRKSNTSESTKDSAEIVNKFEDVMQSLNNKSTDLMMSKLVNGINDLYDLYEIEQDEKFDLVVIHNGLNELCKSGGKNLFSVLNNMNPNSQGHRCGVRFIVVNDVDISSHRLDDDAKETLKNICENADVCLNYNSRNIIFNDEIVKTLEIESGYDDENFIESKCSKIATKLSQKSQKAITYEELGCFEMATAKAKPVVTIPVGKNGNEIVEMAFSCFDVDNSDVAKSIGLMVLGQSGSGKSSLYHSIIINGSLKYSPKDLEFWLLDFKSNSSAGLYSDTNQNIPHIKIVAPNSRKNDAFNILQLLDSQMAKRNSIFNEIRSKFGKSVSNLFEYNEFVDSEKLEGFNHLPHIILMIDEVQELFRDEGESFDGLYKQIGEFINKIVSKGRSSGIHLSMFGQNLDSAKTYILKDNFINQSISKACFKLTASSVSNSGYGGEFVERKNEIEKLGLGEIYLSYSNTDIKKCRVSFAGGNKQIEYLEKIIEKYKDFEPKVLKIGMTEQLSMNAKVSGSNATFMDKIINPVIDKKGRIHCPIGEDSYSLKPVEVVFDSGVSSSMFLIGNNRGVATSILATALISLSKIDSTIHVCRGMLKKESIYNHLINESICEVHENKLNDIDKCIASVYQEYKKRKQDEANLGDFDNKPIFVFLNDFDNQEKIAQNAPLIYAPHKTTTVSSLKDILKLNSSTTDSNADVFNGICVLDAIKELVDNAFEYNIFFIVLLKETWYREFEDVLQISKNVILFNDMSYSTFASKYNIKFMLKDIKQGRNVCIDDEESDKVDVESFAIKSMGNDVYLKFRPVMFDVEKDKEIIEKLLKEN